MRCWLFYCLSYYFILCCRCVSLCVVLFYFVLCCVSLLYHCLACDVVVSYHYSMYWVITMLCVLSWLFVLSRRVLLRDVLLLLCCYIISKYIDLFNYVIMLYFTLFCCNLLYFVLLWFVDITSSYIYIYITCHHRMHCIVYGV